MLSNETVSNYKSNFLTVPPYTFEPLENYELNCKLMNSEDDSVIAQNSLKIKILERGILLKLPFDYLITKANAPIIINAFVKNLDEDTETLQINWYLDNTLLEHDLAELQLDEGLSEGSYTVTIEVTNGNVTERRSSAIQTIKEVSIIQVDTIKQPFSISQEIVIHVGVLELYTFCSVQWLSVSDEGFENIDLNTLVKYFDISIIHFI